MPWAPDYASVATLKSALRITDTDDDAELTLALSGASRAIDGHCGRQFGQLAAPAARYYTARWDDGRRRWIVVLDDLMTVTGLEVHTAPTVEGVWDTELTVDTDFHLAPRNRPADGLPWTLLIAAEGTTLPCAEDAIRVTATWGWSEVPDVVVQATILQATRLFRRKDAPFGVAGSPEVGSEVRLLSRLDPDVALLVAPLRRAWGAV